MPVEQDLVEPAINLSFMKFQVALEAWLNAADPDGDLAAEQVETAGLSIRPSSDGSLKLEGELDPIRGTEFYNAIEIEKKKLCAHDQESGTRRSQRQLNLDALMNLIRRGATRADGSLAQPLINVVIGQTLAEELVRTLASPEHRLDFENAYDPTGDDIERRCEFLDGTPLHPTQALSLFGAQTLFRRVVFSADARPEVSPDQRFFPAWMKQVVLIESRGTCSESGCDADTHWLHADHVKPPQQRRPDRLRKPRPPVHPRQPRQVRHLESTRQPDRARATMNPLTGGRGSSAGMTCGSSRWPMTGPPEPGTVAR